MSLVRKMPKKSFGTTSLEIRLIQKAAMFLAHPYTWVLMF